MREILFRGKRADRGAKGKWVYGDLSARIYNPEHDPHGCQSRIETDIHTHYTDKPWSGSIYTVDPDTVGQYTGLTDKNGKKIFEGDILKIYKKSDEHGGYYFPPLEYPVNVIVVWDLSSWTWETITKEKYYIHFPQAWCHYQCEIIGNIYDNPELMEVSE